MRTFFRKPSFRAFFAPVGLSLLALPAHAVESLVITNSDQIWNASEADRHRPLPVDMEINIYYYDAAWHVLWGTVSTAPDAALPFFLPVTGRPLPIHGGERVRLQGTIVITDGIDGDRLHATVVAANQFPVPITPDPNSYSQSRWHNAWSHVEGVVASQNQIDAVHGTYNVLTHDRLITVHVLFRERETMPELVGDAIGLDGVYVPTLDPTGRAQSLVIWTPSIDLVKVNGSATADTHFSLPITPIDELGSVPLEQWVHIAGRVQARVPGRSVTLRDEQGQTTIQTEDPETYKEGDYLEAVGRRSGLGVRLGLEDVFFRHDVNPTRVTHATLPADAARVRFRLAEQVMSMRPEQATQGLRVALTGVVTWSDKRHRLFYFADSSGGIEVHMPPSRNFPAGRGYFLEVPDPGEMVLVYGKSAYGAFAPEVDATAITDRGVSVPPTPETVTLDQAMTGGEEARWVQISGYVRQVEADGDGMRLDLTTTTGEFSAYAQPDPDLPKLTGAQVRVIGVCSAIANDRHQLTGIRILMPAVDSIEVEDPPPINPFSAPRRTIASLRQFRGFHATDERVTLGGVVQAAVPGRYFYLQEDDAGLLVLCRDPRPLAPGQWVDVVGLPDHDGSRLVLREAVWRPRTAGTPPAPLPIDNPGQLNADADGRLVRLQARIGESISLGDASRLVLRAGGEIFDARVDGVRPGSLPAVGSVVDLTGVYAIQYDEYRHPRAFSLLLRSLGDIHLVRAPSWWTAGRALAAAGGLGLCAVLGVAWVVVLRRRVARQTEQIRDQLEQEIRLRADLERAARLESLGLLAGGIAHDFNNLLTVVITNLGLAGMEDNVPEDARRLIYDAERGAMRAAEITQQLLTFSKGGDPVRTAVSLPEVVRESAEFAGHGSNVRREYSIGPDLWPANIDRAQIGRVVHNLVLNAAQAMPDGGVVQVSLANITISAGEIPTLSPGRYIKLTISDNGRGIEREHLSRIFEPYFTTKTRNHGLGLATVHSIVKKHQGHVSVDSQLGAGTTFQMWLPAAEGPALPKLSQKRSAPSGVLRILFMDDEEPIRRAAKGLFGRLNHEVTLVGDGAEAVREYRTAFTAGTPYDVVVLDLTVPGGMGGRAAMEELRAIDPEVRAIVSSGYSSDPVMANFEEFGFSAVVAKPYDIKALVEAIHQVARRSPVSTT
ncbi:MAG TPA: ATP-binding protein [Opitutaceae bacterium]